MAFPSYANLKIFYPNLPAPEVYKLIGGDVDKCYQKDPIHYANACALRMSRSFNYAGLPIMKSRLYYSEKGVDDKEYIFSVVNMVKYIKEHFGESSYVFTKDKSFKIIRKKKGVIKTETFADYDTALKGLQGMIVFNVRGWANATGHVTLFSSSNPGNINTKCEDHHCYFEQTQANVETYKIELWELK